LTQLIVNGYLLYVKLFLYSVISSSPIVHVCILLYSHLYVFIKYTTSCY